MLLMLWLWKFHPWAVAGTVVPRGKWVFNDYEFQVWQRKNALLWEPFADGLFVRRGTNEWQVFCFDIQDTYSPRVELRLSGTKVEILRAGEQRGIFDMSDGTFRRSSTGTVFAPQGIGNATEPPGQWWLR